MTEPVEPAPQNAPDLPPAEAGPRPPESNGETGPAPGAAGPPEPYRRFNTLLDGIVHMLHQLSDFHKQLATRKDLKSLLQTVETNVQNLQEQTLARVDQSAHDRMEEQRSSMRQACEEIIQSLPPPAPAAPAAQATQSIEEERDALWIRTIVEGSLADDPALASDLKAFRQELLNGDLTAAALAGQLLVFRSAPPERMPQLLKDVGEAYYRYRPKTADADHALEKALAAWLQRRCEKTGIPNTIQLVHLGDRFDSTSHASVSGRGGAVSQVLGWIVLRDSTKVYTKASVAVH